MPPIDPALYRREDVRRILAERDIAALYRVLREDAGVTQRTIAELTGMAQSEVSEILAGRQVRAYDVLVRIAEGLGIPRELMGLGYDEPNAYGGDEGVTGPPEGVTDEMLRRHFVAGLAAAAFGRPLLAGLLDPPPPPGDIPLPSRLSLDDVTELRAGTEQLRSLARRYGGQADIVDAVANRSMRLLSVPADDAVKRPLRSALSELREFAGWCCFDQRAYEPARTHFTDAVGLARDANDPYRAAYAMFHAGCMTEERGHPNDALKLFQLGLFKLTESHDPRTPALTAWLQVDSASAYAHLGYPDRARSELAAAWDGWQPPHENDRGGMEWVTALVERDLGRLDVAERLAASSVRHWSSNGNRRDAALPAITLAELHVRAGEPRGLAMAKTAIDTVALLRSVRAHERLEPLIVALEARPGTDARELARRARQVATTRV
ncbi:MAG TPA: helix-turn-helix transcriptional regulator [Pseudonocardiaceae bacterium]|nr:helix-turn-helix transcriptional regulator [Pseudonocardiaceae bacterium]